MIKKLHSSMFSSTLADNSMITTLEPDIFRQTYNFLLQMIAIHETDNLQPIFVNNFPPSNK